MDIQLKLKQNNDAMNKLTHLKHSKNEIVNQCLIKLVKISFYDKIPRILMFSLHRNNVYSLGQKSLENDKNNMISALHNHDKKQLNQSIVNTENTLLSYGWYVSVIGDDKIKNLKPTQIELDGVISFMKDCIKKNLITLKKLR